MLTLTDVVAASAEVGGTRSRLAKVDTLGAVLRRAEQAEIAPLVGFLTGSPVQGRIGTGWRTLVAVDLPPATAPTLTVSQVDAALTGLSQTAGKGSVATRRQLLDDLFGAATEPERRFLVALLTGELRQGALEGVMLDAVAKAAGTPIAAVRRAFMLSGRLPATAVVALTGGDLAAIGLELHRPVRPMLAAPGDSLADALAQLTPCAVEYKLDGARIQVHKTPDRVTVYTRSLREITDSVPELVALVRALPCATAVLDGETLAITDDGRPRRFQDTMSRFGSTAEEQVKALMLHPFFFDCLHLDGEDLIDRPLRDRIEALRRAVGPHVIPGLVDPSAEEAEELAARALAEGHEGVMVKDLSSPYAAGRRGKAWQKVKPVHTVDLIVIGAEWGHGRRTGFLSNLHLAARDPDGGPPIMVGKTFKGLTDELLRWQTDHFPQYQVAADSWSIQLRPALVVEIALDGVQSSTRYPGGLALRFARVIRYRPDKSPTDADTLTTLQRMLGSP
ncbi:ATP-dependent DNA ligase [Actinokineospora globicatena]|uniref:ATP-dependent DNA ligase n=1 Tax=Actinokineospora globicatena TaxID=103729 RepID=UPI0020A5A8DE|nr:ATP-dependent DNA ligase [Actinokineospora globicatena]MCP2300555.1 DNA ligase-1 [Actinokineospora globicatena]GLW81099.1 DNA ligase [Actinokineospora globicatena]GLW88292.1 DNA ligase [Actinokineospora globicatena]